MSEAQSRPLRLVRPTLSREGLGGAVQPDTPSVEIRSLRLRAPGIDTGTSTRVIREALRLAEQKLAEVGAVWSSSEIRRAKLVLRPRGTKPEELTGALANALVELILSSSSAKNGGGDHA